MWLRSVMKMSIVALASATFVASGSIAECFSHDVRLDESGYQVDRFGTRAFIGPGEIELKLTNGCTDTVYWKACVTRDVDVRFANEIDGSSLGFESLTGVLVTSQNEVLAYPLQKGGLFAYKLALSTNEDRLPVETLVCGRGECSESWHRGHGEWMEARSQSRQLISEMANAALVCANGKDVSECRRMVDRVAELKALTETSSVSRAANEVDRILVEECGFYPDRTGFKLANPG